MQRAFFRFELSVEQPRQPSIVNEHFTKQFAELIWQQLLFIIAALIFLHVLLASLFFVPLHV